MVGLGLTETRRRLTLATMCGRQPEGGLTRAARREWEERERERERKRE